MSVKPAESESVPRGADEVDFLPSRQESTPLSEATLREKVDRLRAGGTLRSAIAGEQAHADGTELRTLNMRHADAVLDFPTFRELVAKTWPEGVDDVWDCMRIARYYTAEQARIGVTHCILGTRAMEALGLQEMDTLLDPVSPRRLPLSGEEGGPATTLRQASVEDLRKVLRVLKAPQTPDEPLQARLERTRSAIGALVERSPEYLKLGPKAFLADGEVVVTVRPRGRAAWQLAAKFYAELTRMG